MAEKKGEKPPEFDKAAEAIWNAEFLLVVCGPLYEEGTRPFTSSEYCDPATVSNPNKFMGYWGGIFNESSEKTPHEGFNVLKSWRDRFFCLEDVRKRQPKKRPEEESELDRLPRFQGYTRNVSGYLQKVGFPGEEVFENCGNVFSWQCSKVPPCCPKLTPVDRAFRFEIDETNAEAQPIKYIPDRREEKPKEVFTTVTTAELDMKYINEGIAALSADVKSSKDDKGLRRLQRRIDKGQVIKLMPHLQVGKERFPDMFVGYPEAVKEKPGKPTTWLNTGVGTGMIIPEDPKALHVVNLNPNELKEGLDDKNHPNAVANQQAKPAVVPCQSPSRASHLLAHINAIDRGMYDSTKLARIYAADPEKWEQERQLYYQAVSKLYRTDHSHSTAVQRSKKITYNISVAFTSAPTTDSSIIAANAQAGHSSTVLPSPLLEKLLKPGASVDEEAAAQLQCNYVDKWEQGTNGLFYFSNVLSRETHQEPINFQHHDNICVLFPILENHPVEAPAPAAVAEKLGGGFNENSSFGGPPSTTKAPAKVEDQEERPAVHIPKAGRISIVVETVLNTEAEGVAAGKTPGVVAPPARKQAEAEVDGAPPNPCDYSGNTWQLVGTYAPPDFNDVSEFPKKSTQIIDLSKIKAGEKHGDRSQVFEYVLEDRHRHVVKIGCLRSDPTAIKYLLVESPCDEETSPTPDVVTAATRTQEPAGSAASGFSSNFQKDRKDGGGGGGGGQNKKKSLLPTPNHILCLHCHDVARPFVLMTKPGVKDDGFLPQVMATRTKAYKLWEKQMIDSMKQDNNKSLVLLELGADKKMEPCRAYAEKTFKGLKSSKCTMIRISPHNLENKKKGQQEVSNLLGLQCGVIQGLQQIDRLLMEKMRKKGQ